MRGSSSTGSELHLSRVLADAWRLGAHRARFLIVSGLAVFIPIGLVEALELEQVHADDIGTAGAIAVLLVGLLFAAITLIGEVLYSGIVAAAAKEEHGAPRHPIGVVLRSLPYGRLIAADILFVLVVAVGLLALVVPGVVFLTWFSLAAVVIEVERVPIRRAFGRSRDLVRRHFWRSLALLVAAALAADVVSRGIEALAASGLGDSLGESWLAATVSSLVTAPLFALPVVSLYFALAELDPPAATSSGTVAKS